MERKVYKETLYKYEGKVGDKEPEEERAAEYEEKEEENGDRDGNRKLSFVLFQHPLFY